MEHQDKPNPYLSRFAEYQTHFLRNDPWPHIPWKEEPTLLDRVTAKLITFFGLGDTNG